MLILGQFLNLIYNCFSENALSCLFANAAYTQGASKFLKRTKALLLEKEFNNMDKWNEATWS